MGTNLEKFYKYNKQSAYEKGMELTFGDAVFTLRFYNAQNPKMKAALLKHYRPVARQVEQRTISNEMAQEIHWKLFYEVSIIGWKGVEMEGKPLEQSLENFLKLMKYMDEVNPQFWRDLQNFAGDILNYKEDDVTKEDVGNS